jgi:photosystem II stability/assembly factor-like uncharacterized protein
VAVGEERTRRALTWIGVAALGTLVAGVVYLRPSLAPPAPTTPAASARVAVPGSGWRLVSASFGDANHGTLLFSSSGPAPMTTFLTSDGGKTWQLAVRAPRNGYASAVFLDTRTVVAQTVSSLGPGPPVRYEARISRDGGRTWRRLADPRHNRGLGWPAFLDPQHAWWIDRASSPDPHTPTAIWRTSDGGSTWQELVASGLPASGFPGQPVFTDPLHGALLFISQDGTESAVATSDGGESWRAIKAPEVPVQATRLQKWVILRHGHRLLSWLLTLPEATLTAGGILITPQGASTIVPPQGASSIDYIAFVSVSDDNGQTWSQPRPAPEIVQPGYVGLSPVLDDRGRLLVLDDRRLWISDDDGATWAAYLMQVPAELRLAMLVSAVPGALYAVAGPVEVVRAPSPAAPSIVGPMTLIRSTDEGAHWTVVAPPRPPGP